MRKKILLSVFLIFLLLFFLLVIFQTQIYKLSSYSEISKHQEKEIIDLAGQALQNLDVPVGAIIIYEASIIGKGYNTVKKENNIAGHAEINAINNAILKTGMEKFNKLDRDKLTMVSSFEPCEMCKGALLHYNLDRVYFMKNKSLWQWSKKHMKSIKYEFCKQKIDGEHLQDSLFNLHPDFPGRK